MTEIRDTIYALSSGMLPAGLAVVRISGPRALEIIEGLTGKATTPRQAVLRTLRGRNGDFLDQGLVLSFPGPLSFTGENCAEFHLHGSRAVVAALQQELEENWNCRLAEAGEFSRRAFEHGKLDLAEIEGLADLLAAETEMQRRLAVEESFGGQISLYAGWRERMLHARAMLEAELDFADEDDVPGSVSHSVFADMMTLAEEMQHHLELQRAGEIVRDGFKVVISGAPNSGKSSLINYLANRDIAIVTDVAGTTRDVLHCDIDLDGYLVRVFDTAGLRETTEQVERIGIERAIAKLEEADLVLWLRDGDIGHPPELRAGQPVITVWTKADIRDRSSTKSDVEISVVSGQGIDTLRGLIKAEIDRQTLGLSIAPPSRQRHAGHIRRAVSHLREAVSYGIRELELSAEALRLASDSLGRISGRIDTEEILGVIFSSFCIGK